MKADKQKPQRPGTSGMEQIATRCIECGLDLLVLNSRDGPQVTALMGIPCKAGKTHVPWAQGTTIKVY